MGYSHTDLSRTFQFSCLSHF